MKCSSGDTMKAIVHLARVWWLAGLLVALLLLPGCNVAQPGAQSNGITIDTSSYALPFDTPERMCHAPLVMDATIAALGASRWNTSDGARPANITDPNTLVWQGYLIYTPFQVSSSHIYLDVRQQPISVFATFGGRVGADRYIKGGFPQVAAGQRYVLVLIPGLVTQAQQGQAPTWMAVAGAFPIDAQDTVTLRPAHSEGKGASAQQYLAVTIPLSQLTQQLASCK